MSITQNDNFSSINDADDKLESLKPAVFTQKPRRKVVKDLNELEKSMFVSMNSSLGWLGTTFSPFYSATACRLQQC